MGDDMDKVKEVDNGFNHGITLVERILLLVVLKRLKVLIVKSF